LATALIGTADTTYFQQRADYRIEARLDEGAQVLDGRLRMRYHNNAPAALDTLWFHLHLNAFRPDSRWARRELEFNERRFQNLGPDSHAFERVSRVVVNGTAVTPVYPLAPDSTVMGVPLPRSLAAGDSLAVDMDWTARPSTLPRRQARRGRHFDFAQWYPRIAVYDRGGWQVQPLLPQGEFYGEFGSFDVTLDLAADQVMGATGVPVEGDPGWAGAAAVPGTVPDLRRDAYPAMAAETLGLLEGSAAEGRRRVRWRAGDVHHFAWTTTPDYIYEGGRYGDVAIHVLYRPGDDDWAGGVAVRRTAAALAAFDTIFGAFPWPQLTNVHRIEGGGTEFPMMVMNGSASDGLILHEVGHNYVHGILANNEWREGWLDEGFVSYLTNWAHQLAGRPVNWVPSYAAIAQLDREGSQPIGLASADYADPGMYGAMTYTKPSIVFRMLHWLMGDDAFRAALRDYYADNRLQHVTEADLRRAVNAHAEEPMDWFFDQWIHTTATMDYRIGAIGTTRRADGQWVTRVEVIRDGETWMPVDLQVGSLVQRLASREPRQVVEVVSAAPPAEAVLDPDGVLLDTDPSNNRRPVTR
ncbi:MAG TPA: M1 family metallopeptidase, partial [Longimicrobiales bacterium]|nr:M1 family metallopeptidase [Longimicrobiales bacterium]